MRPARFSLGRSRTPWLLGGLGLLFFALFVTRLFFISSFDQPLPPNLEKVGQLPVIQANGDRVELRKLLRPGVPTVISLWASWCEPCFREAPKISELRQSIAAEDLNIIYVNVRDPFATPESLSLYMERFAMPPDGYVVFGDSERLNELTNDRENLIPRTFAYDSNGEPLATVVGYKPIALARVAALVTE